MRRALALLSLAALPLTFTACKTEDDSVGRDEAPREIADAVCTAYIECNCGSELMIGQVFETKAACQEDLEEALETYLTVGDEAGLTYDPEWLTQLKSLFDQSGCDGTTYLFLQAIVDQDLAVALETLDSGKIYYGNGQFNDACVKADPNDADSVLGDDCAQGLVCSGGICRDPGDVSFPEGEPCSSFEECAPGLVCIDNEAIGDTVCAALPGEGQSCFGILRACDNTTVCDIGSNTCVIPPGQGEACAPTPNVIFGNSCEQFHACVNDVCEAAPSEGQPCPDNACAEGLACIGNVCQSETPLSCLAGFQVYGATL